METARKASDGGVIHELPDSAFDLLIKLYARSHNLEIVSVRKFAKGELSDEQIKALMEQTA